MLVALVRYCTLLAYESLICAHFIYLFVSYVYVAPTFSFEWNKEVLDVNFPLSIPSLIGYYTMGLLSLA